VEVNGSGKQSNLLNHNKNYCRKELYSTGPRGMRYQTFKVVINTAVP